MKTASSLSSKSSGNGAQSTSVDIDEEMQKADDASKAAEIAMNEAQAAINEISDSKGNINVSLFGKSTSTVSSKGLLSGITTKLGSVFDKVFVKIDTVKAQFATARATLATALAKLEQEIPEQSAQIQQIMAQLNKIDGLELQFKDRIHSLASKLDLAITGLDGLISGATSFIPGFGWVVDLALDFFVMSDVKTFIHQLQLKLLAV
jgi:uncharacterized phage infection (PIP) family protein YhgE